MRRTRSVPAAVLGSALALALLSAGSPTSAQPPAQAPAHAQAPSPAPAPAPTGSPAPEQLRVEVLEVLPHDPTAFTQGLEVSDGVLYEGTGRVGESRVTATALADGTELARVELPPPYFGEGLTLTDTSLWQLTWQHGVAFERDRETLAELRTVSYEGEGWGLCHQEEAGRLVMSDGSGTLTFRDPETFEPTGEVEVPGRSLLNELECVGDAVYANVWFSDTILRIDPETGAVTAEIDASGLLTDAERRSADVLNGIAGLPDGEEFLITGKLWPHLFRVRFVPAA